MRFTQLMLFVVMATLTAGAQQTTAAVHVITLTQTGCQFLEPEGVDHGFKPTSAADCKAINARTGTERLARAKTLVLKPGTYIFRVHNVNVPYELGFYLRGKGLGRFTLPKVAGGGILPGMTKEYRVTLKEGEYLYSCPLNPTPNYHLVVKK